MNISSKVFDYFYQISNIPRGSGDMKRIADYCVTFAKNHSLRYVRDKLDNVIIYKHGTAGYENSDSIILQGHLDMVCQKTEDSEVDFLKDGIKILENDGFLNADNTTLGADNGIAVAIILAILDSDTIEHPPIEAVFTVDEEIGLIGAMNLDFSNLSSKKMINIDSEELDKVTVSCAGGSDFVVSFPVNRVKVQGTKVILSIFNLQGGHSGVEINSGRVNADILAGRILNTIDTQFDAISVIGGDKGNAIPNKCAIEFVVSDVEEFQKSVNDCLLTIINEINAREPEFDYSLKILDNSDFDVLDNRTLETLIYTLSCVTNGVIEMSAEIDGLVETSMNLGVLVLDGDTFKEHFSLRSNKASAMDYLEKRLKRFFSVFECKIETSGHYPAWDFKNDSVLLKRYVNAFDSILGFKPKVEAIHAGLECGAFSAGINGLDCISIGPDVFDVHTVNERLDISSVNKITDVIIEVLKESK